MLRNPKLGLLLSLLMAGSMWFYVQHVLIAYQRTDAAAHDNPRGNLSDLYPRWLGARELLLHHRDPYSPELTREIQAGYYGRPLDSSRPSDPRDQQGFAYPVYVVFLLAPIITLPFSRSRRQNRAPGGKTRRIQTSGHGTSANDTASASLPA